jgi:hypothetical protein
MAQVKLFVFELLEAVEFDARDHHLRVTRCDRRAITPAAATANDTEMAQLGKRAAGIERA